MHECTCVSAHKSSFFSQLLSHESARARTRVWVGASNDLVCKNGSFACFGGMFTGRKTGLPLNSSVPHCID